MWRRGKRGKKYRLIKKLDNAFWEVRDKIEREKGC